ncbi:MAG: hypothetical protein SynsKO_34770 [Synoicihabitans sp.]
MMKDRDQKAKALRLAVANRWLPQLEVDIEPLRALDAKAPLVTDLDVLAEMPDILTGFRSLVFDCKTKAKESPVNRALWLSGLLKKMGGAHGFCILKKKSIALDHRLFADALGVTLVTESDFELYASSTSIDYKGKLGHMASIDVWENYYTSVRKFKGLERGLSYLRSEYWLADSASDSCRKTLAVLRRLHPEFDPEKAAHVALFFDFSALFARSLALIANQVFKAHFHPDIQKDLSEALLVLLYGGREAYEHRNELYQRVLEKNSGQEVASLSLPEWDAFLKLFRQLLDAPVDVQYCPSILREVGFAYLEGDTQSAFAQTLCSERPQAARFSILIAGYLAKASKLPHEFIKIADDLLIPLQPVA